MNDIDGLMVSYMINITKPDERIYQALCDKYSLDKSKCLFFDDRKENVLAARKFGMFGYVMKNSKGKEDVGKDAQIIKEIISQL